MYVFINADQSLQAVSHKRFDPTQIEVPDTQFLDFPLACWELAEGQLALRDSAISIRDGLQAAPSSKVVTPPQAPLTVPQFKALFTLAERIKIQASADAGVQILWADIQDIRITEINLDTQSVIEGINYLERKALIAAGRAAEVLAA
jgi:hypothetical protein